MHTSHELETRSKCGFRLQLLPTAHGRIGHIEMACNRNWNGIKKEPQTCRWYVVADSRNDPYARTALLVYGFRVVLTFSTCGLVISAI
jgi:hypothetical protein